MSKTTQEEVQQSVGMGNILISTYKYLRDNNILKGVLKNPIFATMKPRVPKVFYDKRIVLGATDYGTEKPFFSYKNNNAKKEVRIMTFIPTVEASKIVEWDIYKNPTLTNPSWQQFGLSDNIEKDISATAFTGGELIGGLDMPRTDGKYLEIGDSPVIFTCLPGEIITITAKADSNNTDLYLRIRLEEIEI